MRLAHGDCSHLQRVYRLPDGGPLPGAVQAAFQACWSAIQAGADALRPGVPGHAVDAAARAALGHGLGRATHDGGTLLGPRWPRYGRTLEGLVRSGEVYTLELGVFVDGHGFVGLEENVVVRESGLDWLSDRQREIRALAAEVSGAERPAGPPA